MTQDQAAITKILHQRDNDEALALLATTVGERLTGIGCVEMRHGGGVSLRFENGVRVRVHTDADAAVREALAEAFSEEGVFRGGVLREVGERQVRLVGRQSVTLLLR